MPCYRPLLAYRLSSGAVVFVERGDVLHQLELPCGQCVGCRLERSRQWAIRCVHEAQLHKQNSFLTLTYDEQHIPPNFRLEYRDFQLFMKRLRKKFRRQRIRFFMCGEYGDSMSRPHFHACLFGWDAPDKYLWRGQSGDEDALFRSPILEALWPNGFVTLGSVTFKSAAYVARYVMKKRTGDSARLHYSVLDPETGELLERPAEFTHMSLKPGIGAEWYTRYRGDVYPHGMVVVNGREVRPPRFYDRRFKRDCPDEAEALQAVRDQDARNRAADNTHERLAVKERVAYARLSQLKREI